jgi:hypothetical protein
VVAILYNITCTDTFRDTEPSDNGRARPNDAR